MYEINCMSGMARRVVRAKVVVDMEFLVGGEDSADRVDSVRMALADHYDDAVESSFWRGAITNASVSAIYAETDNPEGGDGGDEAPLRNCDVGTPEEQMKRQYYTMCNTTKACPDSDWSCRECFAKWAQQPYGEPKAKGS
jgi:hypothetical protein